MPRAVRPPPKLLDNLCSWQLICVPQRVSFCARLSQEQVAQPPNRVIADSAGPSGPAGSHDSAARLSGLAQGCHILPDAPQPQQLLVHTRCLGVFEYASGCACKVLAKLAKRQPSSIPHDISRWSVPAIESNLLQIAEGLLPRLSSTSRSEADPYSLVRFSCRPHDMQNGTDKLRDRPDVVWGCCTS